MADPLNPDEARRRFLAVSQGRRPADPALDIATAKARLRQADPGLDIAPALRLLGEGRWQPALLSVVPWLLSETGRAWLAPALLSAMQLAIDGIARLRSRRTDEPPDTSSAGTQAG